MGASCGFDPKFFELLEKSFENKTDMQKHGVLLIDEMSTRQSISVESQTLTYKGLVDFGDEDLNKECIQRISEKLNKDNVKNKNQENESENVTPEKTAQKLKRRTRKRKSQKSEPENVTPEKTSQKPTKRRKTEDNQPVETENVTVQKIKADHGLVIMFQPLFDSYTQPIAVFASQGPVPGKVLAQLITKSTSNLNYINTFT